MGCVRPDLRTGVTTFPNSQCAAMEHLQGLLLAAVALCAAASSDALNETSSRCWVAADQLSTRLPGHTWRDLMSQAPVSGQSLSLCPSPRTCCTVATERKLQEAAWDHFRSHLRSATAVLRASLADSAAKFRGQCLLLAGFPKPGFGLG